MKYFRRVFKYLRPYWKTAVVVAAILVLTTVAGLAVPWSMKIIVDDVLGRPTPVHTAQAHPAPTHPAPAHATPASPAPVQLTPEHPAPEDPVSGPQHTLRVLNWLYDPNHRVALLWAAVALGLLATATEHGLGVADSYLQTKMEQWMVLDFRSDLFQHAQRLSMAFHERKRAGMLIYAINYQADAAAGLVMAIPPLAQSALTLVGMFWICMTLDARLTLISLVVVPALYYSVGYYAKHIQARLLEVQALEGQSLSIIHEAMSMLRVIVAFGREKHEYGKFRAQGTQAVEARVRLTIRQMLFSLAVQMTTAIGAALVLGLGASHVLQGKLKLGELLVILSYIAMVYRPLESISLTIGSLQQRFVALQMAFNLLDRVPEIRDAPQAVEVGRSAGALTFENVSFTYTGRQRTLDNISFEVKPGQVVAIVGPTGAGKTTLVSLLPRFYDAGEGHIYLDGRDIRSIKLQSLRDQLSIVLQEPLLFSGTIRENILYGRLDATEAQIIEAAKASNSHDFIMRLPKKYQTELGERGVQLSGGERQRIAVARAFLRNAPILILDEPTSSIDSRTEAVILDALDRLMEGRTTFIIAHRLSTIRRSDFILVLDRGRLVERGTHEELLARAGLYTQLHELQTKQMRRRPRRLLDPSPLDDGVTA